MGWGLLCDPPDHIRRLSTPSEHRKATEDRTRNFTMCLTVSDILISHYPHADDIMSFDGVCDCRETRKASHGDKEAGDVGGRNA